jgi:hypothetical protein
MIDEIAPHQLHGDAVQAQRHREELVDQMLPVQVPAGTIVRRQCGEADRLERHVRQIQLQAIVTSMRDAACGAGVSIVTGDTKVVERGKGDGVFITTAGIGVIEHATIAPDRVRAGDAVIVSGDLGAHGIAILSVREGLEFDGPVASDTAPLWPAVEALLTGDRRTLPARSDAGRAGVGTERNRRCRRRLDDGGGSGNLNRASRASGL